MSIKILHLSDIHMSIKNYDTNRMRDKFYEYLKDVANGVDYVVISGDHVYQHGDYDKAKEFYSNVDEAIPGNKEFILVPGNHDVDRSDIARNNAIRGLQTDTKCIDNIHEKKILDSLLMPFKKYFACIDNVFPHKFSHDPVQIFSTEKCDFLLINTALTSYEKNEHGHLFIDITSVEANLKDRSGSKPIIAIGHHTLDSFDPIFTSRVQNLFRDYDISLYLCGHTHKMEIVDYLEGNPTKQVVSGAGVIGDYGSTNGFYLIDYSDIKFEIFAYAYNIEKEKWDAINNLKGFVEGKYIYRFNKQPRTQADSKTDEELLSVKCSQFISNGQFEQAKELLIKHGRVWLEAVGLTKCKDMLDAVPKNENDHEIVYLQGLALLFQGQYKIARNIFQNEIKKIKDAAIKYCFETEVAECSRRLGNFTEAINILNSYKEDTLDDSYWSGVVYELMGYFSKQFNLISISNNFYNKAINIFEKKHSQPDQIEKWHCLYSCNQLDHPVALQPENKPGGFLKGLYYLTNAKYNAINGKISDAIRCINESISSFRFFQSDIYQTRACILKFLIYITSQQVEKIDETLKMLSNEELARVQNEERLYNFIQDFDDKHIEYCFIGGYSAKAKAMMAIKKKYKPSVNMAVKYKSTIVVIENDRYVLKKKQIDYSQDIAEARLLSAILGYT